MAQRPQNPGLSKLMCWSYPVRPIYIMIIMSSCLNDVFWWEVIPKWYLHDIQPINLEHDFRYVVYLYHCITSQKCLHNISRISPSYHIRKMMNVSPVHQAPRPGPSGHPPGDGNPATKTGETGRVMSVLWELMLYSDTSVLWLLYTFITFSSFPDDSKKNGGT